MSGDNIERLLGSILARLDQNRIDHDNLSAQAETLSLKVDSLRLWRASMIGASAIVGAVTGFITAFITR